MIQRSDREKDGIKADVQRIEESQLRFIDEISHEKVYSNVFRVLIKYDEHGNKIDEIQYNPDDTIASRERFFYDESGLLTKRIMSHVTDDPEWTWEYEYRGNSEMVVSTFDGKDQ